MRYKVRVEKNGAIVFDTEERKLFNLNKEELSSLLVTGREVNKEQAEKGVFYIEVGNFQFRISNPRKIESGLVESECLSAPNRLYLVLTRKCNLRCRMCYNESGKSLADEWGTEQWTGLLDEMDRVGVFEARLTGGEATTRPDFLDILDHSLEKRFYTSLATNGVWTDDLLKQISRRAIDDVIVSLDGPREINNWFRVGGSFDTTLNTIKTLKEAGIPKVRINTVLSKKNYLLVEELFKVCRDLDLLLIDFIHPRPFGRGKSQEAIDMTLTTEETLEFNRLVERLRDKYPTVKVVMDFDLLAKSDLPKHPIVPRVHACPAGREFAFVSPQGMMFPCEVAPVQDISEMTGEEKRLFVAGNLNNESLLSIWHNSPVWKNYRELKGCKAEKCFSCQYWTKKCFGTCPIGAYYETGKLNGNDHYCYSHLLKGE